MDNLKTLFEKKQYKLILDLTSSSDDITSIIFRLNAFIALENYLEALNLIIARKDLIYQKDPIRCMDIHIDLLLHENKYIDALNAINEYKNMPYISQKVEEHLKELPNRLKIAEANNKISEINESEINDLFLKSNDNEKIIASIYRLKKYDITPFLTSLKAMLLRGDLSNETKTMGLLLLISKRVNLDLAINKLNAVYNVNPSKAIPPFTDKRYQEIINHIYKLSKDASLEEIATSLFNQYILLLYPLPVLDYRSNKDVAITFISIAKEYLKLNSDIIEFIKNNGDDPDAIEADMEVIKLHLGK